ncbi:MAG: protein kinase domain-containing protein [Planctomycetota bacterium]|jgi:TolB-like protein/Tfp pilus assembly protein PilF
MASNDDRERGFEEAVWQFLDAHLRGTTPDVEKLVREYPEFEDQIRERVAEFQKVDSLFDSLGRADESDFASEASEPDLVGRTIGNFQIVEMIGRGGMGTVYLARDTKLKRSVAVKSIPSQLAADSTARMRFRREAELLASLNHPNIAVIHEIVEEGDCAYLILEHVPGETLAERIAREPIGMQQAFSNAQQIADAVSAAHEKGIVHRDLKPGNIKITPEGRVKVLDFGLAKTYLGEGDSRETTVTGPGRVIGTPAYMSPEQARGKSTDQRADIWSFGCIMFQMLTAQLPFEGETATDMLARIIERDPDWQALPPDTPANIRVLIRRCLEKDPRRRLQHIADAALEIRETLNQPATAPPMTVAVKPQRITPAIAAAVVVILAGVAVWFGLIREAQPRTEAIRLMVLPFENKGSAEDEYFADGITNDIITRLMNIRILRVISAMDSKREQSAEQTAEELYVDYILQGTVKKEQPTDPNSEVRITFELVKVSDRTIVWRDRYEDRDPIEVQSEIAKQVPRALEIALLKHEQRALAYLPTSNIQAYDFYLRGEGHFRRRVGGNLAMAIEMYEKAVKLDPGFALAYCRLSMCHSWMYWFAHDRSQKRLDMAKEAVHTALRHDPELPEAHQALGRYYYLGHRKYSVALEKLYTALESQPRNSDVISFIGFIQRRQGKFEEALDTLKKASELQPLSSILVQEVADTLVILGRYEEAESCYDRAIRLAPRESRVYYYKARLYLSWEGRTDKARQVLNEALQKIDAIKGTSSMTLALAELDVYERDYRGALDRLSSEPNDFRLLRARICEYMGKNNEAKELYGQARDFLESKIAEDPNDERFHSSLGIAYAGLGHNEEATREGELAVDLLPVTKDAVTGPDRIRDLASIYMMVGKHYKAIDQLDFLLSVPGDLSVPVLKLDPAWDPLRDHSRFKKLVESSK